MRKHDGEIGNDREEELGRLVVAARRTDRPWLPWYIALRPWLFCLLFLLLAEIGARIHYDSGTSLHDQRFDNFPTPAAENVYVAQLKRDTAFKIAFLGDSTVVGAALLEPQDSVPGQLERSLQALMPERKIHVWNFGVAGARAADVLCLFMKLEEARPDLVIVGGSYYITAMGVANQPLAEPWLAYNLHPIPEQIAPLLKGREMKQEWEERLTNAVEDNFRLLGMRQALNAQLFGIQPRFPYDIANPLVMIGATTAKKSQILYAKPYDTRGPEYEPERYMGVYVKDITPDDLNGRYYRYLTKEALRSGIPTMTYLTPQNPAMTGLCLTPEVYRQRRAVLSSFMTAPGVHHRDYSGLVRRELFTDNDHLLPEGNRLLAEAIATEILPIIQHIQKQRVEERSGRQDIQKIGIQKIDSQKIVDKIVDEKVVNTHHD